MSKIVIQGGKRLNGSVTVQGSKNAALPVMAGSILNKGITIIRNYPDIADVNAMQYILEYLGCKVYRDQEELIIDSEQAVSKTIPGEITGMLRASSTLIGPMLARFGHVEMAQPGGCEIGERPLDIHTNVFKRLGATWESSEKGIHVNAHKLTGNDIRLSFPSVGATQNAIMAAVFATGETVISNAAKEPEVISLCEYLRAAGADICGEGTEEIRLKGVKELQNAVYSVSADRIVAGTYIAAVAACGGDVVLHNCRLSDCTGFLDVYAGMGVDFKAEDDGIRVRMNSRPQNLNYIATGPYPNFPTDMQSITLSVASVADGNLILEENIFEDRFKTAVWLKKMGADLQVVTKQRAIVKGQNKLNGNIVKGADLRGTAALVIAGLCAEGHTIIENADYVKRGYVDLCKSLEKLGANIRWEDDES